MLLYLCMAKSDVEKLAQRLAEIAELQKQRAIIDERLMILTGVKQDEKKAEALKPEGFSLMQAITEVLTAAARPLKVSAIVSAIVAKYDYRPEATSVRSTAKYMAKRGQVDMNDQTKEFSVKF